MSLILIRNSNPCEGRRSLFPSARWRSFVPCVHIRYAFQLHRSAYASLAFCKHPHLNTAGRRTRLCGKKYLARVAGREDFFPANPQGPGLGILSHRSEICLRKSHREKLGKLKELNKQHLGNMAEERGHVAQKP
jgi:hypothetical protein